MYVTLYLGKVAFRHSVEENKEYGISEKQNRKLQILSV